MIKKILIFSAGSAGREVFQLILNINKFNKEWDIIGYVDDLKSKDKKKIDNVKVYSSKNKPKNRDIYGICGIMDGAIRKKIFEKEIIRENYKLTNLIHPSIEKSKCFKIGTGNIIFNNVHISYEVNIKNFSLISNFCDLGHNLKAEDYITVMPSVIVGGGCKIGKNTLIGSGAKIHQGIKIGKNCKIGMGTLISQNIKDNISVVNFPRQVIRQNK